jgi:hypothetical protein
MISTAGQHVTIRGLRRDRPSGEIAFYCLLTVSMLVRVLGPEQATGLALYRRPR